MQTIIIMVVLLAIAGTVAAVLVTRAGEETGRLEDEDYRRWAEIDDFRGCQIAGGRPGTAAPNATRGNFAAATEATFAHCWEPA